MERALCIYYKTCTSSTTWERGRERGRDETRERGIRDYILLDERLSLMRCGRQFW